MRVEQEESVVDFSVVASFLYTFFVLSLLSCSPSSVLIVASYYAPCERGGRTDYLGREQRSGKRVVGCVDRGRLW